MLISFVISRNVPGDMVYKEMEVQNQRQTKISRERSNQEYARISHEMGVDQPLFYFSLSALAYPDTLHRIMKLKERESLSELIAQYGNWPQISTYYHAVCDLEDRAFKLEAPRDGKVDFNTLKLTMTELREAATQSEIEARFELVHEICDQYPTDLADIKSELEDIEKAFVKVRKEATMWKLYVPNIHIHGFKNQFHHWIKKVFTLDFGRSYVDKRPVKEAIWEALPWT
ncbi:MAG: hypothetical protein AAF570_17345, partial [Bacteroidota bacterium]